MFRFIYIYFLCFVSLLFSQPQNSTSNKIIILPFQAYHSERSSDVEEKIFNFIQKELNQESYTIEKGESPANSSSNFLLNYKNNSHIVIGGYYKKNKSNGLDLYAQIYDPSTGYVIDAIKLEDSSYIEGIELDSDEFKTNIDESLDKFSKKLKVSIKVNKDKKERPENIQEELTNSPVANETKFPIKDTNAQKATEDVFKLIEDTKVVTASRTEETLLDVPASTVVITEQDFKNRGYTSLDDVFRDLPGFDYIGTQGTDHNTLYQRGYRTPFTSRTLLMINGIIENDLWSYVMTVTRQYPLSNIKRVEVIYGPASAVYGPNAFQGIVNIITKDGRENNGKAISGRTSFQYGNGNSWSVDAGVTSQIGDFSLAMSAKKYEGDDANKNISNFGYNNRYWLSNMQAWGPMLYYGDAGKPYGKYSDPVNDWGTIISLGYKTIKVGANIWNKYEGYGPTYPGDRSQPNTMWGKSSNNIYAENQVDLTSKLSTYSLVLYRETRLYGNWAEAVDDWAKGKQAYSYISLTRWNELSKSILGNQNIEYKFNNNIKLISGVKVEFKKLTKSYDVPGYWWGSSVSSIDIINSSINKEVEKQFPNGYSIVQSESPLYLRGPSPKNKMPEENTIGTYDRGGFLLSIIDIGKFRFSPGIRYDENSIYGHSLNPRITGIYKLNDKSAFKLLYGEAFNEPSPLQLFGGFAGRAADLKLKPEKVRTSEAIYMHQGKQALNEFSVYYSRYENVIKESAENAGRRRIYGFEYKFKWNTPNFIEKSPPINFYAYYTFTEVQSNIYYDHKLGQWKEGTTFLGKYEYLYKEEAKQLPRKEVYVHLGDIAPSKINLGFNLPVKDLFIFNLRGNYVSRREFYQRNALRDNSPVNTEDPESILRKIVQEQNKTLNPYFIFDTGITVNFSSNGFFTLKVLNVFNQSYLHPGVGAANGGNYYYARSQGFDSSIIPQPGRTYMMNLTITF